MTFSTFLNHLLAMLVLVCTYCCGQDPTEAVTTHRPHPAHLRRTVCYIASWANQRPHPVQFEPEDVDTGLCSHLIFAFAGLDKTGTHLIPNDPMDPELYNRLTRLKRERPQLKVMVSVGGWNMGSDEFTQTVADRGSMRVFAAYTIEFLHQYGFDGLDIDWEFPGERGSPPEDKERFSLLIQTLRSAFTQDYHDTKRAHLLLSVAISADPSTIATSYELQNVSRYVDFINVMTYDMHTASENTVGHHSSLYSPTSDETDSIDYTIQWILKNAAVSPLKLNLGLPFYGRSYNLTDPASHDLSAPISGEGAGGGILGESGFMAYYEVCNLLTDHNDTVTTSGRLPGTNAPYVVDGNRWTGYDDIMSINEKVEYALQQGLGGVFIWSLDMDDFHGICGDGHYPLMNAIRHHHSIIG